VAEIVVLD